MKNLLFACSMILMLTLAASAQDWAKAKLGGKQKSARNSLETVEGIDREDLITSLRPAVTNDQA